jgi:hypothetical protein
MAWADLDEDAGTLVSTSMARIVDAGVDPSYQRLGIGSEMHRIASRELGTPLAHSGQLSPAGHAFAKATGGHIPDSAQDAPTDEAHDTYYPSSVASAALEDTRGRRRPVAGAPKVALSGQQFALRQWTEATDQTRQNTQTEPLF